MLRLQQFGLRVHPVDKLFIYCMHQDCLTFEGLPCGNYNAIWRGCQRHRKLGQLLCHAMYRALHRIQCLHPKPQLLCLYSSLTNNPTDSTTNNPTASTYIACIKNRLPDLISIVWKEKAAKCALVLALGRESLSGIRESREWVSYGLIDVRTD